MLWIRQIRASPRSKKDNIASCGARVTAACALVLGPPRDVGEELRRLDCTSAGHPPSHASLTLPPPQDGFTWTGILCALCAPLASLGGALQCAAERAAQQSADGAAPPKPLKAALPSQPPPSAAADRARVRPARRRWRPSPRRHLPSPRGAVLRRRERRSTATLPQCRRS